MLKCRHTVHTLLMCFAAAMSLGAAFAQTSQALIVKRDTEMRRTPDDQAASVTRLTANASVASTGERQGAWMKVKTSGGATGWLRLFDLATAQPANAADASTSGSGLMRGLGGMFAPSGGKPVATSTLGIRGLDSDDIASASPNPAAVTQGEKLRASSAQAQQFARSAGLQQRQVDDLPAASSSTTRTQSAN